MGYKYVSIHKSNWTRYSGSLRYTSQVPISFIGRVRESGALNKHYFSRGGPINVSFMDIT